MTMIRGAVVTLAAVALAAGVFVSGAKAAPPLCGSKQFAEKNAAACGRLWGADFRACKKLVLDQCKISGETFCSCTNHGLPPCTTGATTPPSACCTQSTPGGPFDQCSIQGLCQCGLLGGRFLFGQFSCTPNPCETTTSTHTTTPPGLPDCVGFVILDPDNTITTIPRGEPVDVPVQAASPTGGTFDVFLLDGGADGQGGDENRPLHVYRRNHGAIDNHAHRVPEPAQRRVHVRIR